MPLSNRIDFQPQIPYREVERRTSKIIFLSCEGSVTEEGYFQIISELFSEAKAKIEIISVMQDIVQKVPKYRTEEEIKELSKNTPLQLVERIEKFKKDKEEKFDFKNHEDEFWIVADVDAHTKEEFIEDWKKALEKCDKQNYGYAISNPFFEIWLLLHHTDVREDDFAFAVTEEHPYEKTGHYRERLREQKAPLQKEKKVKRKHYNIEKVKNAIERAKKLQEEELKTCRDEFQKQELIRWPHALGTTVYKLLDEIVELQRQMSL